MKTHTKTLLASLTACTFVVGTVDAANVLFVDNEAPDASWQTLITSGGNTYTLFDTGSFNLSLNNQASIDYVESFDVIVMSGSNPVFGAVRAHGAAWNTLDTPMITMGNFTASGQFGSSSWQVTTPTTGTAANRSGDVDVFNTSDLIWTGVTLSAGEADLFDSSAGHLILGTDSLLPGIETVAAQTSNNGDIAIFFAEADEVRAGSQEQYFFAGMTGGSGNPVPFSDDGEQVFLNAIGILSGELVPEPGSLALFGLGGVLVASRRRRG